ncbi:hypothetical protein [Arcobacter sp. YIC-310]|uniref:hypothetical protein n=1 Tax=Arcobacter sp. YIC-310 TaxID=3376632 RepID=UPI003C1D6794
MKFILFISIILQFILFEALNATTKEYSKTYNDEILIGFYGRPHSKSLGILGENNIDTLVLKMKEKQAYYEKELHNNLKIKLAFHIIHSLATKDAGRRNDYLLNMSEKTVLKYIKRAKQENFDVILDVQLAVKTPKEAIKPLLKYLKYKNVHLAIDPEFRIPKHRRYPPGKYVGYIKAKELNELQEYVSDYLKQSSIKEPKKIIVHMFHKRMLRQKNEVKNYENIKLIYNIDGHGQAGVKVKIYNALYATKETNKAIGGFKIFYKNDIKPLMSPRKILGFEKVGSQKILTQPYYINYH